MVGIVNSGNNLYSSKLTLPVNMSSTSKVGIVIGTKMMKTIKVRVESIKIHPLVLKVTSGLTLARPIPQELHGP